MKKQVLSRHKIRGVARERDIATALEKLEAWVSDAPTSIDGTRYRFSSLSISRRTGKGNGVGVQVVWTIEDARSS